MINKNKKIKKHTVVLFNRSSIEDSRVNRTVFDVNINGEANDTHGSKKQGFTRRRRVINFKFCSVLVTHSCFYLFIMSSPFALLEIQYKSLCCFWSFWLKNVLVFSGTFELCRRREIWEGETIRGKRRYVLIPLFKSLVSKVFPSCPNSFKITLHPFLFYLRVKSF